MLAKPPIGGQAPDGCRRRRKEVKKTGRREGGTNETRKGSNKGKPWPTPIIENNRKPEGSPHLPTIANH